MGHENLTIADLPLPYRALVGVVFGTLISCALAGNTMVCVAIWLDRKLRKDENLFLISLAGSDILMALLVMSFAAMNDIHGKWIFGSYCSIWVSSDVMCSTASILNLAAISFDRYWHIRYPMKYSATMTRGKIIFIIVVIWCVSAGISFIPFGHDPEYNSQESSNESCRLSFGPTYTVISSTVSFFLPCLVMVIAYVRMYLLARTHVNQLKQQYRSMGTMVTLAISSDEHSKAPVPVRQTDMSDHKARVTVGVIMGVFLASWFPFFCVNIVRAYKPRTVPEWLFQAVTWFGYMNSTANPIIYSIFSQDFRTAFRKLLQCRKLHNLYASSSNLTSHVVRSGSAPEPTVQNGSRNTVVKYNADSRSASPQVALLHRPSGGSSVPTIHCRQTANDCML